MSIIILFILYRTQAKIAATQIIKKRERYFKFSKEMYVQT